MKKILITGGAGFIGSHLADTLCNQGDIIEVWDNMSTGLYSNLDNNVFFRNIDITDSIPEHMLSNWDVIFHLAASPKIKESWKDPVKTNKINTYGTNQILELARKTGSRVVFASSSSVADGSVNPYSFSKRQAEELCNFYAESYGIQIVVTRLFNVYGERDRNDIKYPSVIASFEKSKKENAPFIICGTGDKKRDFIHISDVVRGFLLIQKNMNKIFKEYTNFNIRYYDLGTGKNYSILELAEMYKPKNIYHISDRKGESQETLAEITRNEKELNWKPNVKLEDHVKIFNEWIKYYSDREKRF